MDVEVNEKRKAIVEIQNKRRLPLSRFSFLWVSRRRLAGVCFIPEILL